MKIRLPNRISARRQRSAGSPRRHRRLWAAVGLLVVGAAFHAPLLRCLAQMLIAEEEVRMADRVLVLNCERCFDRASQLYREGFASRFHYIEQPATRLVSVGVMPSWGSRCVRELKRRGLPPQAISTMGAAADEPWAIARCMRGWLEEHPDARVLVLCERFESGATRFALSSVLEPIELDRLAFWCPADPRYDENNWWRSRTGRRELAAALFTQIYFRLHGEDADPPSLAFDPDAYERGLK